LYFYLRLNLPTILNFDTVDKKLRTQDKDSPSSERNTIHTTDTKEDDDIDDFASDLRWLFFQICNV